jgi:alpha-L-rhamnosidase
MSSGQSHETFHKSNHRPSLHRATPAAPSDQTHQAATTQALESRVDGLKPKGVMMTALPARKAFAAASALAALLSLGGFAAAGTPAVAAEDTSPAAPVLLRVGGVADPIGIDDTTPDFQWQNGGGLQEQTAFQVRVASSPGELGRADLWQSGRVSSGQQQVEYNGKPLGSRAAGTWQVRVWSGPGGPSAWSSPARFEMGLLEADDWHGDWITDPRWAEPLHQDVALGEQQARYVRLTVIDLGRPEEPLDDPNWKPRMELGEVQVLDGEGKNLAAGAAVTVSEENSEPDVWQPEFLTDGKVTTADAPRGYRSDYHDETDVQDKPIVVTIDLGEVRSLETVRLFSL